MEQVIYADVYFTVNFSMDFLALFITARMLHLRPHPFRISASAAIGALFALFSLLIEHLQILCIALSLVLALLMCFITFGRASLRRMLSRMGAFMGVCAFTAGTLSALFSAVNRFRKSKGLYVNGTLKSIYSQMPLWLFYLLAGISAFAAVLWIGFGKRSAKKHSACVSIEADGKEIVFDALCDSGDFLCDPISSLPVLVVTPRILKELLPGELYALSQRKDLLDAICSVSQKNAVRVRPIRLKSATGSALCAAFGSFSVKVDGRVQSALVCSPDNGRDYEGFEGIIPEFML